MLAGLRYDTVQVERRQHAQRPGTTGLDGTDNAFRQPSAPSTSARRCSAPTPTTPAPSAPRACAQRYESGVRGDGYFYAGSPEVEAEKADQFELGIKGASNQFVHRWPAITTASRTT